MCKSAAEGGQRCAAHTRKNFERKSRVLDSATATGDPDRIIVAQDQWQRAAAQYASTTEGETALRQQAVEASMRADYENAARLNNVIMRGITIREANKEAAAQIRVAEEAARSTVMNHAERIGDFDPSRETITAIRFACEVHDRPGQCDAECAELASNMNPGPGIDFDPTGTSYPAPAPWAAYHLDTTHKALHVLTYTPNELIDYARHNGGPFEEDGRCIACDGHYKHAVDCPTVRW